MLTTENRYYFQRECSIRNVDLETPYSFVPVFHSVTRVIINSNLMYTRHIHPAFEIIVPEFLTYRCLLNHKEISVEKGQMLIVQTGDEHQDIFRKNSIFYALTFDFDLKDSLRIDRKVFRKGLNPSSQIADIPSEDGVNFLFELIKAEASGSEPSAYQILNGLFQAYFWKVIFAYPESALSQFLIKSSKMEHFRDTLTEIFDSCINRSLTIGEIAEKMYMSESSVAHKCRNILGVSPGKAFMEYKMNKASGLILNTAMTFREISASLGFKNQFHFSKVFRSFYGYSPYEFRKNASGHKSSRMKKAT